jgi:hypothetical protein
MYRPPEEQMRDGRDKYRSLQSVPLLRKDERAP